MARSGRDRETRMPVSDGRDVVASVLDVGKSRQDIRMQGIDTIDGEPLQNWQWDGKLLW